MKLKLIKNSEIVVDKYCYSVMLKNRNRINSVQNDISFSLNPFLG